MIRVKQCHHGQVCACVMKSHFVHPSCVAEEAWNLAEGAHRECEPGRGSGCGELLGH